METKHCKKCNTTKDISKFGICRKSKDGYQYYCTDCRNEHQYADNQSLLYQITNPNGETYVGCTKMKLWKRWWQHKTNFIYKKRYSYRMGTYPLLHQSFETYGVDNHTIQLISELGNISRTEMLKEEKEYIFKHKPKLNIYGK